MSDKTGIEWTDATWNPVTGCAKVSQGCKHCYAEREWPRMTKLVPAYAGRDFTDVRTHADRLDQPIRWKRPRMIFVNSMSDLFHPDVPDEFIDRVFAVMALSKQHVFQVLTKRPERMRAHPIFSHSGSCLWVGVRQAAERLFGIDPGPMNKALPNVWLGVSVEDQAAADERIPLLLDTPAAVRWISAEPLLGPVDLLATPAGDILCRCDGCMEMTRDTRLDWVVVGGESGPKSRPMHPQWARDLRDQCAAAGVPFLFKQWGEWVPRSACYHTFEDGKSLADEDPSATRWPCIRLNENGGDGHRLEDEDVGDSAYMQRVGKKAAGRLLDGVTHDEYPDMMPQAIRATDAQGRSCIYLPVTVNGKVVDSKGFAIDSRPNARAVFVFEEPNADATGFPERSVGKSAEGDRVSEDLYVLVCERDVGIDRDDGRPIVFEQYIDNGAASLESVKSFQVRLGDKYGKTRIAKLQFVDAER